MKKRIISAVLSAVMAMSSFATVSVFADGSTVSNVKISGRYDTSVPVYVSFDGDGTVQWQSADSKDSETWTDVSGATEKTWVPYRGYSLKWIRAVVTPTGGGDPVISEVKQIKERWWSKTTGAMDGGEGGALAVDKNYITHRIDADGMVFNDEVTDYQFTIDNQKFALLDTTEDENSHFLVMSQYAIGARNIATGGQVIYDIMGWLNDTDYVTTKYDDKDKTNSAALGYAQNTTAETPVQGYRAYCESSQTGDFKKLPSTILDNIDENAVWKQEPKMWEWGAGEITYVGGISIPAWTEYEKYAGKVSVGCVMSDVSDEAKVGIWTRTPLATESDGNYMLLWKKEWEKSVSCETSKNSNQIRPIFYLKRDFFLESEVVSQIDLDTLPVEVRNTIVSEYTRDELTTAGYDADVINKYKDEGTSIAVSGISGETETSLPVTVKYSYDGNANMLTFKMYSSDSAEGEFTVSATQSANATFTIPVSLSGKYIKFSVENMLGDIDYTDVYKVGEKWERETAINTKSLGDNDSVELTSAKGDTLVMRKLSVINATTPTEYTFKVTNDKDNNNTMEFILLDTKRDDDAKFLVMTKNNVGTRKLEEKCAFTSTVDFLNSKGDYESTGYTTGTTELKQLPTSITNAIDQDHIWKIERRMYEDNETTVTGGIVIPAVHEIREYSEKIGLRDDGVSWWTRTPYGLSGDGSMSVYVTGTDNLSIDSENRSDLGTMWTQFGNSAARGIRPMFCLSKNFFTDNHINLADMGEETLNIIRKVYSRSELKDAGYSEDELSTYYDVSVGTLSRVSVKGLVSNLGDTLNADTRTTLTVDMKYDGSENSYTVTWYKKGEGESDYSLLTKGQRSIDIPDSYAGSMIKATVTLKDEGETSMDSEPVLINDAYQKETAINDVNEAAANENGGFFTGGDKGSYVYRTLTDTVDKAPVKWTFTYDGVDYILLDRFNDDDSRYLIMTKKSLISATLFSGGSQNIHLTFDWLNNRGDFTENGFRNTELYPNTLPQAILSHVNEKAVWQLEPKMFAVDVTTQTGGLALPSVTELRKYKDKMSIKDDARWWFRTPDGRSSDGRNMLVAGTELSIMGSWPGSEAKAGIRPIFYVDKDFFNEVKVENMGTEVAKAISGDVNRASLKALGYTPMEIYNIIGGTEPSVKVQYSTSGNNSTADFAVKGYDTGDKLTFIYAIYSEDNSELLAINIEQGTVTADDNGTVTKSVTISNAPDGTVKVFLWEGDVTALKPSSIPITVE